jgi:cytochrome P450 family 2 subfamily U polypeptide 1
MFFFILYIGIVSSSGIEWKHQRTFALSKLRDFGFGKRSFESRIMEEIKIFLDLLESYNGEPFDISKIIQTSMSNNIMSITIGRRFDYDDPNFKYFVQLLHETVTNAAFAGPLNFIPFLAKIPGDPFRGNRMKQIADQIFDFFRGYISEHEQTLDSNNIRDFIDVYLTEMKENKNSENSFFTGE